jgi:ribosomal protein L37E
MYCQKCGRKLTGQETKCPHCGFDNSAEYNGGFWDILEKNAQSSAQKSQYKDQAPDDQELRRLTKELNKAKRDNETLEDRYNRKSKFLSTLLLICLVFFLIQSVRVGIKNKQYEKAAEKADEYDQLEKDFKELEKSLGKIKNYSDLQKLKIMRSIEKVLITLVVFIIIKES